VTAPIARSAAPVLMSVGGGLFVLAIAVSWPSCRRTERQGCCGRALLRDEGSAGSVKRERDVAGLLRLGVADGRRFVPHALRPVRIRSNFRDATDAGGVSKITARNSPTITCWPSPWPVRYPKAASVASPTSWAAL
jgi:hypothetical protein